ncbi:MAG TPA: hypothetical protein ENO22_09220 [candidate division Zixibacteria bacterium]|nr:hypothetical protein [candidate division Zixibacteria bacterium]HEQ99503.1 hypothetical protein [candidate division Zixibacteria bacterium]
MRRLIYTSFIMLLLLCVSAYSADIAVESSLDRNKAYIGDRIGYSLIIEADSAIRIDSLEIPEDLGEFEIKNWLLESERVRKGVRKMEYSGILTVFETGKVMIPPLPIVYHPSDDVTDTIYTDSMDVFIMSLVLDDSAADIRDLKGVKSLGENRALIIIIIVLLLAIAAGLMWYFFRKKPEMEAQKTEPLKSPWDEALERLARLRENNLDPKDYYIELSDTIRRYVERRYGFSATDMTTYEIKQEIPKLSIEDELNINLSDLLDNSDLVKFARFMPDKSLIEEDFQRAWVFVNKTKPGTPVSEEVSS